MSEFDADNAISLSSFSSPEKAIEYIREQNKKKLFEKSPLGIINNEQFMHWSNIVSMLSKYNFEQPTPKSNLGEGITFIVGLPRSGKTSLEQILSSTQYFMDCGENTVLSDMFFNLQGPDGKAYIYPDYLPFFSENMYQDMGKDCLRSLSLVVGDVENKNVVITTPTDFLYIPIIHKMLPGAKVVWCHRNSKRHCINMFMKSFKSDYWNFTNDANELVKAYISYLELYAFYKEKIPNAFYNLDYNKLLKNPKNTIKDILDYLEINIPMSVIKTAIKQNKTYLDIIKSEDILLNNYIECFPELEVLKS